MNKTEDPKDCDVVAVNLKDGRVLWVEEKKTRANADAIVSIAVHRQGVKDRFFAVVATGEYKEGDKYQ